MAVVDIYTTADPDPATRPANPIPSEIAEGRDRVLTSHAIVINGNSIASVVHFGKIPSNALIGKESILYNDALTGVTDFDLGFLVATINGLTNTGGADNLIDGADIHTAGSNTLTGLDIADLEKHAWEHAGYSNDPGGDLELIGTLNAGATATGDLTLVLKFRTP